MAIQTVSLVGLGALGVLYGHPLSQCLPQGHLRVIADLERIARYTAQGVFCNGQLCHFEYVSPDTPTEAADLVMIAVKSYNLNDAIKAIRQQVGEHTVILSLINGITSEGIIGNTYGMEKMLYCVAQGTDAVKVGNKQTYSNTGWLSIGEGTPGPCSARVNEVAAFLNASGVPCRVEENMKRHMWGKFMLNVGVNQTAAVYRCGYGGVQHDGPMRDTMLSAMREVLVLSDKEGIHLTEDDIRYWAGILDPLDPAGMPSMQQDVEAGRPTEVELFSGTILELGRKYGIPTPVNQMLFDKLTQRAL